MLMARGVQWYIIDSYERYGEKMIRNLTWISVDMFKEVFTIFENKNLENEETSKLGVEIFSRYCLRKNQQTEVLYQSLLKLVHRVIIADEREKPEGE